MANEMKFKKTHVSLSPQESLLPWKPYLNLSFRTRPPEAGEIRNPVKAHIIRFFLDPGSRPALRDLAGMTNATTARQGEKELFRGVTCIGVFKNLGGLNYACSGFT
jgi:hypothetical protein